MQPILTYQHWLKGLQDNELLRKDLESIEGNTEEIEERFGQELAFGTAGLRGKLGAGTNRMNEIMVGRATQGIANYITLQGEEYKQKGVAVAFDGRHFSKEFAHLVAEIFAANGIKVYIFPSLRPTPELAYAIRQFKTASGINITASHNPKEYNGYKVYWDDGAQVMQEIADAMSAEIDKVDMFHDVQTKDFDEALKEGIIEIISEDFDTQYLEMVKSLAIRDDAQLDKSVDIVYTPLNGAGSIPVMRILKERGFTNVAIVKEQQDPDPDFTTVGYPNPENTKAFALAEKLGAEVGAEVLIATDPDSDRMAIEVRDEDGSYKALNGNQTGVLLIHYILEGRKAAGTLPEKGAMVKSIVTGEMGTAIAKSYNVPMYETLTGFKNICGKIPDLQREGYQYLFGYEESIGYAASEEVRDKDGISATMLLTEACAYYKKQGKTLLQVQQELFEHYGYYVEEQLSIVLEGIEGQKRIGRMMDMCRDTWTKSVGNMEIAKRIDYLHGYEDVKPSNVLRYYLDEDNWFAVRPSGTEPKIKLYFYVKGKDEKHAQETVQSIKDTVVGLINDVE